MTFKDRTRRTTVLIIYLSSLFDAVRVESNMYCGLSLLSLGKVDLTDFRLVKVVIFDKNKVNNVTQIDS